MQRMKASDFPKEVLGLFDRYVHGGIDRREFIEKASKYAVGGMTAAAMLEALRPNFVLGEQIPASDSRIKGEDATCPSPQGNGTVKGYLVRPAKAEGKFFTAPTTEAPRATPSGYRVGKICRFFDTEKRRCTIYTARPTICREYPGGGCGYYSFLMSERNSQEDSDHIASTWNV